MFGFTKPFLRNYKRNKKRISVFLAAHGVSEYSIIIIFSVVLGLVAGLTAVAFHKSIEFFSEHIWTHDTASRPFYFILLVPAIGMFLQWLMTRQAPKQAKQRGVLEIIKATSLRQGEIPFKTTLFHFFAPLICIATGGTVGPEAPVAQSGAGTVSFTAKILGIVDSRRTIFAAAGAGAAIAGVFNTPLAGIFFSLEVILLGNFQASAMIVLLLTSVSSSIISRLFLGNEARFIFSELSLGHYSHYGFYLALGIVAGLLAVGFIISSEYISHRIKKLYTNIPKLSGMLFVGLLMGAAGLFFPGILGIGYESINEILVQGISPLNVSILFLLKFVLVILILGAGGFGGIFAPSIFMGACVGYLFAFVFSTVFNVPLDFATYTLVGMGAMLAGINSIPITSIMILFEMTDNYHFILPLMLGVVGSHAISHMVLNGSIYQRELEHAGLHLNTTGKDSRVLKSMLVEDVTRLNIFTVASDTPISEVVRSFLNEAHDTIYITTDKKITGVITSSTMHKLITEYESLRHVLVAEDIADTNVVVVDAGQNLEDAISIFAQNRVEEIPVIYNQQPDHILGTLHYKDVLNAYDQTINKQVVKDDLFKEFQSLRRQETSEIMPGFSLAEMTIPNRFIGKSLKNLRLRNKYKIDVLMVERSHQVLHSKDAKERLMPDQSFVLKRGDRMIVYGRSLDVINFREMAKTH